MRENTQEKSPWRLVSIVIALLAIDLAMYLYTISLQVDIQNLWPINEDNFISLMLISSYFIVALAMLILMVEFFTIRAKFRRLIGRIEGGPMIHPEEPLLKPREETVSQEGDESWTIEEFEEAVQEEEEESADELTLALDDSTIEEESTEELTLDLDELTIEEEEQEEIESVIDEPSEEGVEVEEEADEAPEEETIEPWKMTQQWKTIEIRFPEDESGEEAEGSEEGTPWEEAPAVEAYSEGKPSYKDASIHEPIPSEISDIVIDGLIEGKDNEANLMRDSEVMKIITDLRDAVEALKRRIRPKKLEK